MEITAKILADSINRQGVRLTTMELYYHRYVLPEFNTHRDFSRNGASSRAIPTHKLIEQCEREMVEPLEWGLDQSGMQAFTVADPLLEAEGRDIWDQARDDAIFHAKRLSRRGFAKQIVNRVLEPYLPTRTVVSSTNWANFDTLRDHPDAQPEIRKLAREIIAARRKSKPNILGMAEWHTPYILPEDEERFRLWAEQDDFINEIERSIKGPHLWFEKKVDMIRVMVSAARCARASYRTVEGKPTDFRKDLELFQRLVVTQPVHASPTEHQATPGSGVDKTITSGNFRGWSQFRKIIHGETVRDI